MTKHLIDIDDALLAEAKEVLGSSTMKETVNRSLSETVATEQRRNLLARLIAMDGLDFDKPEVMDQAWS